uniref:DUF4283 domain-containing protein n=1 Tax=Kalanchoe fedtschenkoi TaxID=63787 RepID=A0A7N1A7X1_KALFE
MVRWTLSFDLKNETSIMPFWIRMSFLRAGFYDIGFLECIGNQVGRFLDDATKMRANAVFARIFVEMDLVKFLPNEIWIDCSDGIPFWHELMFEGKIASCMKCRMRGHSIGECRKVKKYVTAVKQKIPVNDLNQSGLK